MAQPSEPIHTEPLCTQRIQEIAELIEGGWPGVVPSSERRFWESRLDGVRSSWDWVAEAEQVAAKPGPQLSRELFETFWTEHAIEPWDSANELRHMRLRALCLGELREGKGRFLPIIANEISAYKHDHAWVAPRHDWLQGNRNGNDPSVDLHVAARSASLAAVDALFCDRLDPSVRLLMRREVERRTFAVLRRRFSEGRDLPWWVIEKHNWNVVCFSGVVLAALQFLDDPNDRALFVAAAERYHAHYLEGFGSDGCCLEGVNYWNYGFSHFVWMSESLFRASHGRLNWLADPAAARAAAYFRRVRTAPGCFPTFSDCHPFDPCQPEWTPAYLEGRRGGVLMEAAKEWLGYRTQAALHVLLLADAPTSRADDPPDDSVRSWFPDAAVYVGRPRRFEAASLVLACKGGTNSEPHNHNDLGSFTVWKGATPMVMDPGREVYNKWTFSGRRYESDAHNSFGHPVPIVDGKGQEPGGTARVLSSEFGDDDTLGLDLTGAYACDGLLRLTRTFCFRRRKNEVEVCDEFVSDRPLTFASALVTFGKLEIGASGEVAIQEGEESLVVVPFPEGLSVSSAPLQAKFPCGRSASRIQFAISGRASSGRISLTLRGV